MKKPLRTLPPETCGVRLSRRTAVRQVGGWALYIGTVTAAACGRTPLGEPLGGFIPGDDDDDGGTNSPTPTQTLTPTPTPEPCTCEPFTGAPLGLNISAFTTMNMFAVNNTLKLFICRDELGFYAMSDLCTHAGNHILNNGGSSYNTNNLDGGFTCGYHGTHFNSNGMRDSGPAAAGSFLTHYLLTINPGNGELYIELGVIVDPSCRCNPV